MNHWMKVKPGAFLSKYHARTLLTLVATLMAVQFSKGDGGSSESILNVQLVRQETRMWCWAASGQMIMSHLGTNISQCLQASDFFKRPDCCPPANCPCCVNGGWPQFQDYGFEYYMTTNDWLDFTNIQEQIAMNRPIAFSWHWIVGGQLDGGHMMVIYGWRLIGDQQFVLVHDPDSNDYEDEYEGAMPFNTYVGGADHTHWNDYFDIKKYDGPN